MPMVWMAWLPLMLCLAFSAKFLAILLGRAEDGSAAASLLLAFGFAALAVWLFRLRGAEAEPVAQAPLPATPRAPVSRDAAVARAPTPRPDFAGTERRRHARVAVDWKVEIAWHHAGRQQTHLHDLSRGGARLVHREAEPKGRRGLLLVPGLNLPVPFTVVESAPETGLHIRFDLEGMGLDALEQQLDALVARGAAGR